MSIAYAEYDSRKHLDQLVELERDIWGNTTADELKEIFGWKYPAGAPLKNAFVAVDGERLVAFRGFFINTYRRDGRLFPVAVLGDAVTDPAYQRQGIFSKLTGFGLDYYKEQGLLAVLSLSSNEKSSAGNRKLGWKPFARRKINIRPVVSSLMPVKKMQRRLLERRLEKRRMEIAYADRIEASVAAELARYCAAHYPEGQTVLSKDERFWLYRYAAPHLDYRFAVLRTGAGIAGYVCYMESVGSSNGIRHVKLLDISARSDEDFDLLITAVETRTDCKMMLIYTSSPDKTQTRLIGRKFRFSKYEHRNNASDDILVKPICAEADVTAPCAWALSYIDIDSM